MAKATTNSVPEIEDYLREWLGDKIVTPREFVRRMTRLIQQHPDEARYSVLRAWAHYDLSDFSAALKDAQRAVKLCPQSSTAWHFCGSARHHLGQGRRAEADLSRSIRLAQGDELWLDETYLYRGAIRCDSGRPAEAVADFTASLKLDPKSQYAYLFRGHAHCFLRDFAAALKDYQKAVAIKDGDQGRTKAALSMLLATCPIDALRNGKRALKLAQEAVTVAEVKGEYQDSLAAAYAEVGRFDEAVAAQKLAIRVAGDPGELKTLRAQLKCYQQGQAYREP